MRLTAQAKVSGHFTRHEDIVKANLNFKTFQLISLGIRIEEMARRRIARQKNPDGNGST